jgi:hypothetical protein
MPPPTFPTDPHFEKIPTDFPSPKRRNTNVIKDVMSCLAPPTTGVEVCLRSMNLTYSHCQWDSEAIGLIGKATGCFGTEESLLQVCVVVDAAKTPCMHDVGWAAFVGTAHCGGAVKT